MQPGIFYDMPFDEYAIIPALNSSVLKWGQPPGGSMLHLKAAIEGRLESDDTKDRKFGRALHVRLLEPDRYKSEVLVATRCIGKKKDGATCGCNAKFHYGGEWYCGTHKPAGAGEPTDYVSVEEAERIEEMAAVLRKHDCQRLFKAKGWSEVSVFWEYRTHLMKARLDRYSEESGLILDIKKAQVGAVHKAAMENSIKQYGWHRQAAMYVDGIGHETGRECAFAWVFQEDNPPYDVGVLRASPEVLDAGRFEYKQIISNYEYACRKDKFDGQNPIPRRIESVDDLESGGLPGWYLQQFASIDTGGSYVAFGGDSERGD